MSATQDVKLDFTETITEALREQRRTNDGLLHVSSHFIGSLRHVQLEVAGAPQIEESLVRQTAPWIGTLLHDDIHRMLRERGVPYMAEVNVTPWMPDGWGGTADIVLFQPELSTFILRDIKSQKGEGMYYIVKDGAKDEHIAQTSFYWHALAAMGLSMDPRIGIYYLPKSEARNAEPMLVEFEPRSKRKLYAEAAFRKQRVDEYREQVGWSSVGLHDEELSDWVQPSLEPVQEREQKLFYDKATETWDLKLVPHWSAAYCKFPDELCDCSTHGSEKIGMFDVDGVTYIPRKGYEDYGPEVTP